jgi:hypothetical protein
LNLLWYQIIGARHIRQSACTCLTFVFPFEFPYLRRIGIQCYANDCAERWRAVLGDQLCKSAGLERLHDAVRADFTVEQVHGGGNDQSDPGVEVRIMHIPWGL